jgi:nucleotide-binding universal stress UspA family protein
MTAAGQRAQLEAGRRVFSRVAVGIDGSPEALEAARQAALLEDVNGRLTLFSAWDIAPTIVGATGSRVPYYFDAELQRSAAERNLAAARDHVSPYAEATAKLVRGTAVEELLKEIDGDEDTLVAVGSSGTGRLLGIVEGAVATELVHRARCSVLVARPAGVVFPTHVVVGVDGSVESAAAYSAARYLASRFDARLDALVAWGGKAPDERLVATITGGDHSDSRKAPVDALVEAAEAADLVVVGSRGLHGVRALGSVSERVAHTAACSALVVREPVWQRVVEELGRWRQDNHARKEHR